MRVLLIEPHDDTRELYAEFLRYEHFIVVGAPSASDALPLACDADVVVVAHGPRSHIETFEFVRALRHNPVTVRVPVVVLSTTVHRADRTVAAAEGCDAFLPKPCLPSVLVATIHRVMRAHRRERSAAVTRAGRRTHQHRTA